MKNIRTTILLLIFSGVLTGFVAEQLMVFQKIDNTCLCDGDSEKKDNSENKKFGEDDKVGPKELSFYQKANSFATKYLKISICEPAAYLSSGHISILTPPPERR